MSVDHEVIAVRIGEMHGLRSEHFYRYSVYDLPDGPLHMDFYFWVLRSDTETILVDTGFDPDALRHRPGRTCLIPPMQALAELDIAPEDVTHVVVTHLHYDHIGNLRYFPNARFSVQRKELDYWTGPYATRPAAAATTEADEIAFLVEALADGRVDVLDGDTEVRPGISTMLVPGHCPGQQVVLVDTPTPVLLASDALHFYEEMTDDRPFEIFFDLEDTYRSYDLLRAMEDQGITVVAGHDPEVMTRFEPLDPDNPGFAVRIN